MVNSFILAGALTFNPPVMEVLPPQDAPRYVAKALYKELELDEKVSQLEKKYIMLDKYPELAYIGVVVRIIQDKRITYTWTF